MRALAGLTGFVQPRIIYPNGSGELEEDRRRQGEYALIEYTEGKLNPQVWDFRIE